MVHIKVKKGLDIPIKGKPVGQVQKLSTPVCVSLNLSSFEDIKFRLLVKKGDLVSIGQALALDKACPERLFVSPGGGRVKEIRRGLKRRLLDIVIELSPKEEYEELGPLDVEVASREEIISKLQMAGLFAHIRMRPCNVLADPKRIPNRIFIKAIESAPFVPSAEKQVEGYEKEFQMGLMVLSKLTQGSIHLVYRKDTDCRAFNEAQYAEKHSAEGPHPVSNTSVHIHHIDPIMSHDEIVWSLTAYDVLCIGVLAYTGRIHHESLISIAGEGIIPDKRGYYKVRNGCPVAHLLESRKAFGLLRYVSGDLLTGKKVEEEDFLGFYHKVFCSIHENVEREFLHFFRLGFNKFSATKTYLSGLLKCKDKEYDFTTNKHGEERAFVDPSIYSKVMPMQIPVMHLVKAILSGDFDLAENLGLLEVDSEDFALPTFICPCKIEMSEIVKNGLRDYAKEFFQ